MEGFAAVGRNVMVTVLERKAVERKKGKILLPQSTGAVYAMGLVTSVGDDVEPSRAEEGDTVLFHANFGCGSPGVVAGESVIIEQDEIVAVAVRPEERCEFFAKVDDERDYQDEKFGRAHDEKNTEDDWYRFIVEYAGNEAYTFEDRMVKVAALAEAAAASENRKLNKPVV